MIRVLLFSFMLLVSSAVWSADAQHLRRGQYIRTEVRNVESSEHFIVRLVPTNSSLLQLELRKTKVQNLHEVRMYETVREVVQSNSGQGITQRGTVEYVVVPGKLYEGEHSERVETVDDGPLKNKQFTINNRSFTTDANGYWFDDEQIILGKFDDIRINSLNMVFSVGGLGEYYLELTRNFIRHEEESMPGVEKAVKQDILEALELDFGQQRLSSSDGLKIMVSYDEHAKPGEVIPVTVEITNRGMRSTSNLIGRSFSSVPGINGKFFYFGMIPPGQSRRFFRLMTVPDRKGACYCKIAFWCTLGKVIGGAQNIKIDVE